MIANYVLKELASRWVGQGMADRVCKDGRRRGGQDVGGGEAMTIWHSVVDEEIEAGGDMLPSRDLADEILEIVRYSVIRGWLDRDVADGIAMELAPKSPDDVSR
jgi:hypothetical protein